MTHAFHLELEQPIRLEMTEQLNQLLADSMTLRDLYKKSHWQVAGPTFYQLHLLFDKHFGEQVEIVDTIAERIQLLGGLAIAMAADVAETTQIATPAARPGRSPCDPFPPARRSSDHHPGLQKARRTRRRLSGIMGTNDLVVSDVLRTNELQAWFMSEHLVEMPLVHATSETSGCGLRLDSEIVARNEKGRIIADPALTFSANSTCVAGAASAVLVAPLSAAVVSDAVVVPRRLSRGKNGVTSNGILSRTEVICTGAALIISTRSPQGSSLMRPPNGSAAIWSSLSVIEVRGRGHQRRQAG